MSLSRSSFACTSIFARSPLCHWMSVNCVISACAPCSLLLSLISFRVCLAFHLSFSTQNLSLLSVINRIFLKDHYCTDFKLLQYRCENRLALSKKLRISDYRYRYHCFPHHLHHFNIIIWDHLDNNSKIPNQTGNKILSSSSWTNIKFVMVIIITIMITFNDHHY